MWSQNYRRMVEELRDKASMFWPPDLSKKEAELSVIPKLLETQDQFIVILSVNYPDVANIFQVVNLSTFPANLFLKHLVVLADVGGEQLMRINSQFGRLFPSGKFRYFQSGRVYSYRFKVLPVSGSLNNDRLGISGKKLLEKHLFSDLLKDVAQILIFGSACENEEAAAVLSKCEISNYLGQPDKLAKFVKQRYIWVSRITSGAQANTLGQIAQDFVKEYLENNLKIPEIQITRNGCLPGVTERENRPVPFDIVVSDRSKYAAVEVSFQVTTNSTIERKAGQAKSRFEQVERAGYRIAYVIDGAGNFERKNAIRALCLNSHCTIAFSRNELDVLCEFLRGYFATPGPQ